jgi:hypothetical protein
MTKNTNTKSVVATTAAPAGSLMDMLTQAVATQATGFKQTETVLRAKAKQIVGADVDLITLQTMEAEAESLGLPQDFLTGFKAKAKEGRTLLIEAEAAGQAARRLQATSTVEGLAGHIDQVKARNAAKAEAEKKAKAQEAGKKAMEAREARIAGIVGQLGELTHDQAHSISCFLRGNPDWNFKADKKGMEALKSAAFAVAAKRKAFLKAEAKGRAAEAAAAASLTHKVKLNK